MVPAGSVLPWALLLILGAQVAGAQGQTQTPWRLQRRRVSFHSESAMPSSSQTTSQTFRSQKMLTLEDENDAAATADQLASPAASELLASSVATGISHPSSGEEEGVLEDDVLINARKNSSLETPSTLFPANSQDREIRLTTRLMPSSRSSNDQVGSELIQSQLTPGSTPSRWPPPSPKAMPPMDDIHLVMMPWGPWRCHCRGGTMSRYRGAKLVDFSGRLRPGALSQVRTEHRPCTYKQCPCNRNLEECPLDTSLCEDCSPQSRTTSHLHSPSSESGSSFRPSPIPISSFRPSPSPSPALAFWKQVRIRLEDIWNNLSSIFTEMQPIEKNQR
ncbi:PREDICTED: protein MENT [Elephantulus edwardii]|uniref:protein MENT n=1 Tax=Elephantulus edwardii TaxID=28737 RepID=UPI0003F0980D|nr:PREDICTED: protein MENT [Elephantulus edwardii]